MLIKSDIQIKDMPNMDISFYNNGPMKKIAEEGLAYMDTLEKEEITMESFDGYKLHAFYFPNPNGVTNKFLLGMHGFKSGSLHEYAPYIKYYFDLGFSLVLPDERAHYRSEGKYITLGVNERIDVVDWSKFMVNKFGENIQILIQGVSMGASSVNLASCLDLPKQVIGIVSDCAYTNFKDIMVNVLNKIGHMPVKLIIGMISVYMRMFMHINLKKDDAVEAVKHAKVPILYMHGRKDQIVPVECSEKLYNACASKKKLCIVEEANHAESIAYEKENYLKIIQDFFEIK